MVCMGNMNRENGDGMTTVEHFENPELGRTYVATQRLQSKGRAGIGYRIHGVYSNSYKIAQLNWL